MKGPIVILIALLACADFLYAQQATLIYDFPAPERRLSTSRAMSSLNNKLIFSYVDETKGEELFIIRDVGQDPEILKEINPGAGGSNPHEFVKIGEQIFFIADSAFERQLWVTNGTTEGTHQIRLDDEIGDIRSLTAFGDKVVLKRRINGTSDDIIYISDGSVSGTFALGTFITDGSVSYPDYLTVFNNHLYFLGGYNKTEKWISDGTVSGTRKLLNTETFISYDHIEFNGRAFYSNDFGNSTTISDGSVTGTKPFDLTLQYPYSSTTTIFKNKLFAAGGTINGSGLYSVDSTDAIVLCAPISVSRILATSDEKMLIADADNNLWISDGTSNGTILVGPLTQGGISYRPILGKGIGDGRFIIGSQPSSGGDLSCKIWLTNGTPEGTTPYDPMGVSGKLSFDVNRGFVNVNETAFIWSTWYDYYALLYFDEIDEAVKIVKKPNAKEGASPTVTGRINDALIIEALDVSNGFRLWKSEGAPENTVLLDNPDEYYFPVSAGITLGDVLIFQRRTTEQGHELWKTDGTQAGTSLIKDLFPGSGDSNPSNFFAFNSKIYFWTKINFAPELWSTDGTAEGTLKVTPLSFPRNTPFVKDQYFYYFYSDVNSGNIFLRKSDGTEAGTFDLHQFLNFDNYNEEGKVFFEINGSLLFLADDDGTGLEIWKLDLITGDVSKVSDINPGTDYSYPSVIAVLNGKIVINKNDGTHGLEVWVSDGSAEGTYMLGDLNAGSEHSVVSAGGVYNDKLYFTIYNNSFIFSTWYTDGTPEGTILFSQNTSSGEPFYERFHATHGILLMSQGGKLFRSEGTPETTNELDLGVSFDPNYTSFHFLKDFNDLVLFRGYTPDKGDQLWALDFREETQTIEFDVTDDKSYGDPDFELSATVSSGLPITYSSLNTRKVSVQDNTAHILEGGEVTLRASQGGNSRLKCVHKDVTINIARTAQTVTFEPTSPIRYSNEPVLLSASATSGLRVKFKSANNEIIQFWNGVGYLKGIGEVTVEAIQEGNGEFLPASASKTITIIKALQEITAPSSISFTYSESPQALPFSVSSNLTLDIQSSDTTIVSIENGKAVTHKTGEVTLTINQTGNDFYESAEQVTCTLTVVKDTQTITFATIQPQIYTPHLSLTLSAYTNISSIITFSSMDTTIATVNGNVLNVLKPGEVIIWARANENDFYFAAETSQTISISKAPQTISIDELGTIPFTTEKIKIQGSSSSGLPLRYESSSEALAVVNGDSLALISTGSVTLTAIQDGDDFYESTSTSILVNIIKADQHIFFDNLKDIPLSMQYTLGKTIAVSSSGLPVKFSSSSEHVGIVGDTISFLTAGNVELIANQYGDARYNPAATVTQTFCILPLTPSLTYDGNSSSLISDGQGPHEWFVNGEPINYNGNEYPTIENGVYTVRVNIEGCLSELSAPVDLIITNVESNDPNTLQLFPNPATSWIKVLGINNETSNYRILIYDTKGNLVLQDNSPVSDVMDISTLPDGIYQLVVTGKQSRIAKFVKY